MKPESISASASRDDVGAQPAKPATWPFIIELRKVIEEAKPRAIDRSLKRDLPPGWLLPALIATDARTWQRWDHWSRTITAGRMLDEPIPPVPFEGGHRSSPALKMLERCLNAVTTHGEWRGWSSWQCFDYFLDWLLYAFGELREPPEERFGCEGASMRLYQTFSLETLMAYPYDYFGDILADNAHGRHSGFFPTPMDVASMMAKLTLDCGEDVRAKTVCDPAAGTGRMLLVAAEYSYRLYAVDIDSTVLKALKVNAYCWAPWLARPFPFFTDTLMPVAAAAPAVEVAAQLAQSLPAAATHKPQLELVLQ